MIRTKQKRNNTNLFRPYTAVGIFAYSLKAARTNKYVM